MPVTDIYDPALTVRERFRLVEIAHETADADVRDAALCLFRARKLYEASAGGPELTRLRAEIRTLQAALGSASACQGERRPDTYER